MWANFNMIPDWIRTLFVLMTSVTWGLPTAKEHISAMVGSIARGVASRRDYKLEKARINRAAVYYSLKTQPEFKKGLSQHTVDILESALNAGETE